MLEKPLGRIKNEAAASEGKPEGTPLLKVQHRNLMSGQAGRGGWEQQQHLWFPSSLRERGVFLPSTDDLQASKKERRKSQHLPPQNIFL